VPHEPADDAMVPPDAVGLRWIGHATVLIALDGSRILTDPVLLDRVGFLRRHGPAIRPAWYAAVDAVLISHLHRDHLHLPSLALLGHGVRLIVPRGAAPVLHGAGFRNVEELAIGGGSSRVGRLEVRATPANHSGFRPPFGPTAEAVGYVVQGSRSVYFAGDTDLFPEMADLAPMLDLALLPVGGWGPTLGAGHLDPLRAAEALARIRPSSSVPIHWGTLWPVGLGWLRPELFSQPAQRFAGHAAVLAPGVEIVRLRPGEARHVAVPRVAPGRAP